MEECSYVSFCNNLSKVLYRASEGQGTEERKAVMYISEPHQGQLGPLQYLALYLSTI